MSEFILNLNAEFENNADRIIVHKKIIGHEKLTEKDKPAIVAYLTLFEMMYRLIIGGVIRIEVLDDLFRSRFFKAIYNVDIQNLELLPDADGYLNIYNLEHIWIEHLNKSGIELKRGDRPLPESARKRSIEQVHFTFKLAKDNEAEEIHRFIEYNTYKDRKAYPGYFYLNNSATIRNNMEKGFVLKAYSGNTLAGIILVHFPSEKDSHSNKTGDGFSSDKVAHIDIGVVAEHYRGYGLFELLIICAERHMYDNYQGKEYYYATVHPDNLASISSLSFTGYEAACEAIIHDKLPRRVFRKMKV